MAERCLSIAVAGVLALTLAACGAEAPPPPPAGNEAASPDLPSVMGPERRILAFGDSLFAGYNLGEGEGYPARLEAALRARGINARLIDGAVSGDTSAAGLARLAFLLDNLPDPPELALVELGGNDLLRGIAPSETKANLAAILEELKRRGIPALLMGMRAPPNLGAAYQAEFDAIYPDLARQYGVPLVPFLLEPVYDKPELMLADRIHPAARGVEEMVAATLDEVTAALPAAE